MKTTVAAFLVIYPFLLVQSQSSQAEVPVESVGRENQEYAPPQNARSFQFNQVNKAESYPALSANGLEMVYVHNQSVDWVFYTTREDLTSEWAVPIPIGIADLGSAPGAPGSDGSSVRLLSAAFATNSDGLYVTGIWNGRAHILFLDRKPKKRGEFIYRNEVVIQDQNGLILEPGFIASLSFCDNEQQMFAYVNQKMLAFSKTAQDIYHQTDELSVDGEGMGKVSEDGLSFVYCLGSHYIDRSEILVVKRNALNEAFSFRDPRVLYTETIPGYNLIQPHYCAQSGELVIVYNRKNNWVNNDIDFATVDIQANLPQFIGEAVETNLSGGESEPTLDVSAPGGRMTNRPAVELVKPVQSRELETNSGKIEAAIAIGSPFPNPSSGVVHFYYSAKSSNSTDKVTLSIFDNRGRLVKTSFMDCGNMEGTIDGLLLPSGSYSMKIRVNGLESDAVRFMIEK